MKELILASASPRRRELLADIAAFTVEPSLFEERARGLSPQDTVLCFAEGKAQDVFSRHTDCMVLGADTVVALDGEILGKPKDEAEARSMLLKLSGRTHSVFTGICLIWAAGVERAVVETKVTFYQLDAALIEAYVKSGAPLDKAGAYGIQDGYPLVKSYEGSYTNVVGLPVEEVRALVAKAGGTNAETCD